MKILIILSRVPYPLEKGDKLRAYNHIRFLSEKNDVHLFALNDSGIHPEALNVLGKYCKSIRIQKLSLFSRVFNLIKIFFSSKPFQIGYFYNCKAKNNLNNYIDEINPDHIFCQLIRVAEYVKNINIPKTLDYQDVFSKGVQRRIKHAPFIKKWAFRLEYNRLVKYEKGIFDYFDNKIIISQPDRDLIQHPDKEKIKIIPNGVDSTFFSPIDIEKEYELVFTGNMAYPPNIDSVIYLVKEIMPKLIDKYPNIKLLISGSNPHNSVISLKSNNVVVSGWVEDIRHSYAKAKIFVAPMRIGTGLQNKLLEAMAMKIPCITSKLANNALGAKDNVEILTAETAEGFANQIISLIEDEEKAAKIASNAICFVKNNYNWNTLTTELGALIEGSNHNAIKEQNNKKFK